MAQINPEPQKSITGYVDSDGYSIFFRVTGSGTPLILVHGWGADSDNNWVETGWVDFLNPYRKIISIDIRGHGKSDKPYTQNAYGYAAMSADVLAVMNALEIEKSDFMGYSMGAFIGAHLLGHHPQRFSSMVLGGIGDETESSAAQGIVIAQALRAKDTTKIDDAYGHAIRAYVEANPDNDLQSLAYSALEMWPEGYPRKIAGPDSSNAEFPVLIVNGENDHPYVDSADLFVAALSNARHVKIPGTDHLSVVADERFKKVVLKFLLAD